MIISNKYKLLNIIGKGNYGDVYIGEHIYFKKNVAIKLCKKENNILLKNEAKIYNLLQNTLGVPNMLLYGLENEKYFIIIEKLDSVLERYDNINIYNLGIKMIEIIENIHEKGIIHRDLKPDNFMFKNNKLYLIDYGMATVFLDRNNNHLQEKKINNIIGSINYISINVHNCILPSRRDDVESILYILLYLQNNKLPWSNLDKDKVKIYKENIENNDLIENKLKNLIKYIRNLSFVETPDYKFIYKQLKD